MKNILKAVSLFAVVVFVSFAIISCSSSKDPITGLYTPPPTGPVDVAPENVPESNQAVKDAIDAVETLPIPAYRIVYLHFGAYRIADDNMGATITIDGNNKAYSLVIGIEEISSSGVAYFEISDAQWTLDPTSNNAVSEQNGKLTVSNSFYSDNPATISLTATYKGITKTFTFVLATDAAAPAPPSSFVPSSPVMTGTDGKTYQIEMQSGTNWVVTGNYISVDKNFPFSNHTDVQARVDGALHKFIWGNNAFASDGTTPVDISSIMTPVDSGHNQITQAITLVIEIYVKDENYTEMDPNKALPNMPSALKATYVLKVQ